jgi:decaprenylphospho-beta-D-ribofuranose 2-oxidase
MIKIFVTLQRLFYACIKKLVKFNVILIVPLISLKMQVKKNVKISGWGNFPVVESSIFKPRIEDDFIDLLKNNNLIARGLGRSYSDQALNEGNFVVLCTAFNHLLFWDEKEGLLECEAGVSLDEIITIFAPKGWFPMICPGTKFVTIGGAIANDIHGKAHHVDGSFVNCIESFRILLADGQILKASRTENADLYWANFGGLGLLGIILTATMKLRKIETTFFNQKSLVVKNLDQMLATLDENDHRYNYSVAWIDPLANGKKLGSGVITFGNAATFNDLPTKLKENPLIIHSKSKLTVPVFLPPFALNNITARLLNRVIAFVQNSSKKFVHYEKFFFPLDSINNWNKAYGKRGFIQYQFVIPETNGKNNLAEILEMISKSGCIPFLNVFKKMGEGQGILSFPFKGYTLAIDFPMTEKLLSFIPRLDEKVLNAGGRLYLGKDALLHEKTFQEMYPKYKEWLEIKEKYDPLNKFNSNISRRLGLQS